MIYKCYLVVFHSIRLIFKWPIKIFDVQFYFNQNFKCQLNPIDYIKLLVMNSSIQLVSLKFMTSQFDP